MVFFQPSKWLIFCAVVVGLRCDDDIPAVRTYNGVVTGTLRESYGGRPFSSFEGIPYAKPPIGDLRFEPPQRLGNWTGIWVANTRHVCVQSFVGVRTLQVQGDEDCLYLNVYVPRTTPSSSEKLDVIVHVHGGAFMLGSPFFYAGPRFLMDKDVVLVTMSYRLGPFGFLATEDEVVPGNMGLKDQSFALKWIQENIENFGGNRDSVTLTGMSAGGACTHFHYLSPLSKGIFHRGISQSGNVLNPWAMQEAPLEKAVKLAGFVGCEVENTRKLVDCLRQRPAYKIAEAVKKFFFYDVLPFSPFGPVAEVKTSHTFLPDFPYQLLSDGHINDVPWIVSVTSEEGIFPGGYFYKDMSKVETDWEKLLPHLLDYGFMMSPDKMRDIATKIKDFYFKGEAISAENYPSFVKMISDRHFFVGSETSARIQSKVAKSHVYHYMLGYRGQNSFSETFQETEDNTGVSHADDVLYYFETALTEPKLSEDDEQMKSVYLEMITSFAKTGVPTIEGVEWRPVSTQTNFDTLYIKSPRDIKMQTVGELAPGKFWASVGLTEYEDFVSFRDEL